MPVKRNEERRNVEIKMSVCRLMVRDIDRKKVVRSDK
jgi:hypothetical protein